MTGKTKILASAALLMCFAAFVHGPVPQEPMYHDFADSRMLLGVPNGANVLSNLFLVLPGIWGAAYAVRFVQKKAPCALPVQYLLFFAGVVLSGIGSSWYHLDPSNASLIWDRMPMSIAFMAFFSSVISETIDQKTGGRILAPLVALGLFSVAYWAWTESAGRGDLRPYALVQFLPVILVPLILVLYKPPRIYGASLWLLLFLYVGAKLFELFDRQFFVLTGTVSGHTMKHVAAGVGVTIVAGMLRLRKNGFLRDVHIIGRQA